MEILSDATFKGNVDFKGGSFKIHSNDGPVFSFDGENNISEFGNIIGTAGIDTKLINLRCSKIKHGSYYQFLQSKSGTIALTSDLTGSVKFVWQYLNAPSDCTLFAVDLGVTDFSLSDNDRIISARVDKYFSSGDTGKDPNINGGAGCYWEPTSMDVILSNAYGPGKMLIRKASGVVCDNTQSPFYRLKVFYL